MKILNFGSLNIDYVYAVGHFVRPGETILSEKRDVLAGGKGLNQSVALARALCGDVAGCDEKTRCSEVSGSNAGIEIFHAGCIGKTDGTFLKRMLTESGVNTVHIAEHDAPTGHAIIQVDKSGQNCIMLFGGANQMQSRAHIDETLSHFEAGDFLILQNEINELAYIIEKAHEKQMVIFLNPSPCDEKISKLPLQYVNYFLLNEVEAADILKMPDAGEDAIASKSPAVSEKTTAGETISSLRKKFPTAKIVLTLGKNGVAYFDGARIYSHGIYDVKVADTTAAGDTFTGYFVASVAQKLSAEDTLRLASAASSIAVSRKGASPSIPTIDEVEKFLEKY